MPLELNGRVTVYTNQVPYETDILRSNLYQMTAVSKLAQTILGTGIGNATLAAGLPCTPVSPPGLQVVIGPGVLYSFVDLDDTAYGVLPIDNNPNHKLLKQAINFDPVTLNTPAPTLAGNSIIYLVQGIFQTVDVNNVSRPYFNSASPSTPIFNSNFDTRQDIVSLNVKASAQAPTPAAPTPDAGYSPFYYVIVTFGQTSIISGNISVATNAPFITESLTQKISSAYVGANLVTNDQFQKSFQIYANDIGTTNVMVANPSTTYTAYVAGTHIFVKAGHSNTGSATLNINSLGAKNIQIMTPGGLSNLSGGEMVAGGIYELIYDGTQCQLINPMDQAVGNYVTASQLQQSTPIYSNDTGATNALVANPGTAYGSYVAGTHIFVKAGHTNTGASTLNINSNGATNIRVVTPSGLAALSGGEMILGGIYEFIFDGTQFLLTNPIVIVSGSYVTKNQEQQSSNVSATDSGSVNAIVLTPSPVYGSYSSITFIRAVIANSNTGAATININGHGAIPVKILNSTGPVALSGGEMVAGGIHEFCYNQADNSMQLMNPLEPAENPDVTNRVGLAGSQSLFTVNPVIHFDTVIRTNGIWNSTTYQFTPNFPGQYAIYGCVAGNDNSTVGKSIQLSAVVNGSSSYSLAATVNPGGSAFPINLNGYIELGFNGTTDNVELMLQFGSTPGATSIGGDATKTYFGISYIGPL